MQKGPASSAPWSSLGSGRECTTCAAVADCQWLYVEGQCDHVLHMENFEAAFINLTAQFASRVNAATRIPADIFATAKQVHPRYDCNSLTARDLDAQSLALISKIYAEDFR